MSLLRKFSFDRERDLGRSLADFLSGSLAPVLLAERRHVLSANRVSRLLEQAFALARAHKKQHGMGFLGRTVTAKAFKSSLEEKGYPDDFVSIAVEGLIVELSRRVAVDPSP